MTWLSNIFLQPLLLWFLPLALLPIALHLLTLHRLHTVELSTFRFLFDTYVQQRRRLRFLEIVLAALRALFVLLLVAAFGRPFLPSVAALFGLRSDREVVMLFDCSASMNAASGGMTALERSKRAALQELDRLERGQRLTIVRVGARPEEIFNHFAADKAEIRGRIDALKVGPTRGNFYAALSHLFGPEAGPHSQPLVYLFTDAQATGWREVRNQGLDRLLPADAEFVVVNAGTKEASANVAVVGGAPRRHRTIVGLPLYLYPRVVNFAPTQAEVMLSLLVDDKEVGRTRLTVRPGDSATERVIYFPGDVGTHRCRFALNTSTDVFRDDDHFDFPLTVVPPPRVLLINGHPARDPLDNDAFYLRTALEARSEDQPRNGAEMNTGRVEVTEITEAQIKPELLRSANVVILANCGELNGEDFTHLRDFVARGGGLLLFPGDRIQAGVYNDQFFHAPGQTGEELIGVRFGNPEGELDRPDTFERFAAVDFTHRVMAIFEDAKKKHFQTARFYRRFPLLQPEKAGSITPLAQFADGRPALVEGRFGDGVVFVAAFPADTRWTNLPTRPDFWPLLERLVAYAQNRPEVEAPALVRPDSTAVFTVRGDWQAASGTVIDPEGRSVPLEFNRAGNRLVGVFEHAGERGFYQVQIQGGKPEHPHHAATAFAVNIAPEESDPRLLDEEQFRKLLPGASLHFLDATTEAAPRDRRQPLEIYRWLIYLLFVILAVEFTLATVGGKHANQDENAAEPRPRRMLAEEPIRAG